MVEPRIVRESGDPFECGSFLAFLKLEQKVEKFEKLIKRLAAKRQDMDAETSAALIMGRYRDGHLAGTWDCLCHQRSRNALVAFFYLLPDI